MFGARHFQYKVEMCFKETILESPFGKTKCYAIGIEFQAIGCPHAHSLIWIFNAPNIQNENSYIEFTDKTRNSQLSDHFNDPEFFEFFWWKARGFNMEKCITKVSQKLYRQ